MYSCADTLAGGLPHSDIHGSTPARGSPWLFAACHVLHRLLVPRHPPNALLSLKTCRHVLRRIRHHAQKPSSVIGDQRSVISRPLRDYRDQTPNAEPRTILYWIILLRTTGSDPRLRRRTMDDRRHTQHTPLNTLPRSREDPSRTRNPRETQTTSGQTCDRGAPRDAPEPDLQ